MRKTINLQYDRRVYHAIVRSRVRALWRRVGSGDYRPAIAMAAPGIRFDFKGDTGISARFTGRAEFERWFERLFEVFPGLRLRLTDVIVRGWPWRTTLAIRLSIAAELADGTAYRNEAVQWVTLRWGRMTSDEVFEDTLALDRAIARQLDGRGRP